MSVAKPETKKRSKRLHPRGPGSTGKRGGQAGRACLKGRGTKAPGSAPSHGKKAGVSPESCPWLYGPCRSCGKVGLFKSRHLCSYCYRRHKNQFPTDHSRPKQPDADEDFNGGYALPDGPIPGEPGSEAKLAGLAERVRRKVALHHPRDEQYDPGAGRPVEIPRGRGPRLGRGVMEDYEMLEE